MSLGNRIAGVVIIFVAASFGWGTLGYVTQERSDSIYKGLAPQVAGLWGAPQKQVAPSFVLERGEGASKVTKTVDPDSSDIAVTLSLDFRRKGLLWYRTYVVTFDAAYAVTNSLTGDGTKPPPSATLAATALLPCPDAVYDGFSFTVNGAEAPIGGDLTQGIKQRVTLAPGQRADVRLRYTSRGMDTWAYAFGPNVARVRHFSLLMRTDFSGFDFPTLSPTEKHPVDGGWEITWAFESLISPFEPTIELPSRLNPGPLAARISYFAPVGLLFLLGVVLILGVVRGRHLHPMHYFLVCSAFFAFHLLFSYLVDHLEINLSFALSAVVSVVLVATYLARATGLRFALGVVAPAQILYLVLFSYAFFFEGYTGLTITIASIVTLAFLMHVTAGVDWEEITRAMEAKPKRPPTPPIFGYPEPPATPRPQPPTAPPQPPAK